ncbi:unnamed protein product [Vitrella brassicaformis CCMP3155]|uniref:Uncharacterized protein n=2 Tax=Vitrella brassicaformis TaxID=1169539 RepID=A0A0G4GIF4_VITBC|nr:unnamed protein product [Vitrella brassicaformis CCMP3155]|eukprot:CEM29629.1 unnamed protein product [Vitrella brassicaformis CCMP3155]
MVDAAAPTITSDASTQALQNGDISTTIKGSGSEETKEAITGSDAPADEPMNNESDGLRPLSKVADELLVMREELEQMLAENEHEIAGEERGLFESDEPGGMRPHDSNILKGWRFGSSSRTGVSELAKKRHGFWGHNNKANIRYFSLTSERGGDLHAGEARKAATKRAEGLQWRPTEASERIINQHHMEMYPIIVSPYTLAEPKFKLPLLPAGKKLTNTAMQHPQSMQPCTTSTPHNPGTPLHATALHTPSPLKKKWGAGLSPNRTKRRRRTSHQHQHRHQHQPVSRSNLSFSHQPPSPGHHGHHKTALGTCVSANGAEVAGEGPGADAGAGAGGESESKAVAPCVRAMDTMTTAEEGQMDSALTQQDGANHESLLAGA